MYRIVAALAAVALVGTFDTAAVADPPSHAAKSAKHGHKYEYKYEREEKHGHGHKAAKLLRFRGGPPPWAPAHGYRRKAGHYEHLGYRAYGLQAPPIDLASGRCNSRTIGQLVGGGLGALAGSQIGSGDGRLAAVAAGTIIGVIVGGEVGSQMDRVDALCVDQALENAPDGETIVWNTDRQNYSVTPTRTVAHGDGQYCREYIAESMINGRPVKTYGTACRQPDGSWKLTS